MKLLKKIVLSLIFLICSPVFSQETLTNLNTSWTNVLSGMVISEPVITSYGFCIFTDARTISAFSNTGKLLWEKNTGRSKNVKITSLPEDFILFVDLNGKTLKVLNPSGCIIWSKNIDYVPNSILAGRDGRFFLNGENKVECYSINGICKWTLTAEKQKKIPMQELPDGSVVIFLAEENGQTKGLRISPFGKFLEEITFSGEIKNAYSTSDGILLIFSDGSAGLFSISDNFSENKWVLNKKNSNSVFAVSPNKREVLYLELLQDGIIINELNTSTGDIVHSKKIKNISGTTLNYFSYNKSGLFIIDKKNAALYSKDGKELWFGKLPANSNKNSWNHIIFTNDNHLIFCYKNWTLNAYRIFQTNEHKHSDNYSLNYDSFINLSNNFDSQYAANFSNNLLDEARIQKLESGFYGQEEENYQNQILSICSDYSKYLSTSDFGTRKEYSVFDQDTAGFEKILKQLMLLGNKNSQNIAASILSKTKNSSYQKVLLIGIKNNGYDPDGNILKALEKLAGNVSYRDKILTEYICDAVYSICFFMGRPAYNSIGKDILKNFLYPSFDVKTREYARDTLKKIIALDL